METCSCYRAQKASQKHEPGQLTRREREVAFLVAEGLKNRSIARRLAISPATVATYVQRIQARLDLRDRREIETWIHEQGSTSHPDVLPSPATGRPPACIDHARTACRNAHSA
jgi:DNA-binding NarL/FixJ family response regulator